MLAYNLPVPWKIPGLVVMPCCRLQWHGTAHAQENLLPQTVLPEPRLGLAAKGRNAPKPQGDFPALVSPWEALPASVALNRQ